MGKPHSNSDDSPLRSRLFLAGGVVAILLVAWLLWPSGNRAPPAWIPDIDPLPAWHKAGVKPSEIADDREEDGRRVWRASIPAADPLQVPTVMNAAVAALEQAISELGASTVQRDPRAFGLPVLSYRDGDRAGRATLCYQPGTAGIANISVIFSADIAP